MGKSNSDESMMSSIAELARQYREAYRLEDPYPVEVYLPDWYAQRLVERHGSLQAAADSVFRPGSVKLINQYWHDRQVEARENVERKLTQSSACSLEDLMRIAARSLT
jgi:hypothetical protein